MSYETRPTGWSRRSRMGSMLPPGEWSRRQELEKELGPPLMSVFTEGGLFFNQSSVAKYDLDKFDTVTPTLHEQKTGIIFLKFGYEGCRDGALELYCSEDGVYVKGVIDCLQEVMPSTDEAVKGMDPPWTEHPLIMHEDMSYDDGTAFYCPIRRRRKLVGRYLRCKKKQG